MNSTTYNQRPGKTGASLDGVKCTTSDTERMVDACHLVDLARVWERLAEYDDLRQLIEVAE